MKSIFTGKVMETKWSHWTMAWWGEDGWRPRDEYFTSLAGRVKEYINVLEYPIIHTTDLSYILKRNDIFRIGDLKCRIEKVEYNSDNSITYHTDYVVSNKVLKSYDDALEEMNEFFEKIKQDKSTLRVSEIHKKRTKNQPEPQKQSDSLPALLIIIVSVIFSLFFTYIFYGWI